MRVSVIIPVWNGSSEIEDCLKSVFSRSGEVLHEVICVDNASEDDSVQKIEARFPEAKILRQRMNLGFAGGVNVGIDAATGDAFVLLNQDCVVEPGWLEEIVAAFESDSRIGIVGVTVYNADGSLNHAGAEIVRPEGLSRHLTEIRGSEPYAVDYVTGAAYAVRRATWAAIGRFDDGYFPAYFEEVDYCYRARRAGFETLYAPAAKVIHLFSSKDALSHPFRYAATQHRMRYRFVCKHFQRDELEAFFSAEVISVTMQTFLDDAFGRAVAARDTLQCLNDILERRRLDLGEDEDTDLQVLMRQGFARIARQALAETRRLVKPRSEQLSRLESHLIELKQREYGLIRRIYFRDPTDRRPESMIRRLWRLVVLRPLSLVTGRDYFLMSELNACHVSRLDAYQDMLRNQNELIHHTYGLFDLFIHHEDV